MIIFIFLVSLRLSGILVLLLQTHRHTDFRLLFHRLGEIMNESLHTQKKSIRAHLTAWSDTHLAYFFLHTPKFFCILFFRTSSKLFFFRVSSSSFFFRTSSKLFFLREFSKFFFRTFSKISIDLPYLTELNLDLEHRLFFFLAQL